MDIEKKKKRAKTFAIIYAGIGLLSISAGVSNFLGVAMLVLSGFILIGRSQMGLPKKKVDITMTAEESFSTKVVGVTFDNENGVNRQEIVKKCKPGEHLFLLHRPDEHDQNAIQVVRCRTREQLGFLKKEEAEGVANHIVNGGTARAIVTKIIGGYDGKSYGCVIDVIQADKEVV